MHPDSYYEMRSEKTEGNHGHQACYNDNRLIIRSGITPGSADKAAAFPSQIDALNHVKEDVRPWMWALHLDGNPCAQNVTTLTRPIMHEGVYLKRYMEHRPAFPNDKPELQPGEAP